MTKLPGGLRVVTDSVPGVHTVALGVWVGVGTRHEDMINNGVAHLTEHMIFKGTEKRNAQEIVEVIENVGGNVNAYTSREVTSYHIHLLKDDLGLALEVLADIVQNSTMPEEELEKERHVVLQEIGMCNDTPDDVIFDNYYETAYPDQAIGAPILGKADIVGSMSREVLMDYVRRFYTPGRMVVSAAGAVDHDAFVAQVGELFSSLPPDIRQGKVAAYYEGGEDRKEKELEQSHVILGFKGIGRLDDDYTAVQTLSTLLGGGMSSRLFQEIREKRGLVYSIFSFHSAWLDDGQFGIYAGTGPNDLKEMMPVMCDEIKGVMDGVSTEELERAKAQLRAGILMGRESMMSRADHQAKYLLYRDKVLDVEEIISRIDAVGEKDISRVAKTIFAGKPTLAGLGPMAKLEAYEKISERLAA
ncbi:MAG: peptidase M16 [Micavibrio sp.]|nr:MAG: peptidase M16 [Micavibrio sp.]